MYKSIKNGCRIVVKVDDIPLGYNFAEDEGQTMLYPVNDHLFGSGEHLLSVEAYPLTTQQTIHADAWVNLKVILYPEKERERTGDDSRTECAKGYWRSKVYPFIAILSTLSQLCHSTISRYCIPLKIYVKNPTWKPKWWHTTIKFGI